MATRKQKKSIKNGYSIAEAKDVLDKYIDESTEQLQKKFLIAWKKQYTASKKPSYV